MLTKLSYLNTLKQLYNDFDDSRVFNQEIQTMQSSDTNIEWEVDPKMRMKGGREKV